MDSPLGMEITVYVTFNNIIFEYMSDRHRTDQTVEAIIYLRRHKYIIKLIRS